MRSAVFRNFAFFRNFPQFSAVFPQLLVACPPDVLVGALCVPCAEVLLLEASGGLGVFPQFPAISRNFPQFPAISRNWISRSLTAIRPPSPCLQTPSSTFHRLDFFEEVLEAMPGRPGPLLPACQPPGPALLNTPHLSNPPPGILVTVATFSVFPSLGSLGRQGAPRRGDQWLRFPCRLAHPRNPSGCVTLPSWGPQSGVRNRNG